MKSIPGSVWTFTDDSEISSECTVDQIRESHGHPVNSYSDLIAKIAILAFKNPELLLLYRGQVHDHKRKAKSTLLPSIYRYTGHNPGEYKALLKQHYKKLRETEDKLYDLLILLDYDKTIARNPLVRCAILQHYELCGTPLLDVSQSTLVACSFALEKRDDLANNHGYLYVLGVPQINGSITVSPTAEIQMVRLSSVSHPDLLRPYFQEGYMVGTFPYLESYESKGKFSREEVDCGHRLVAKFKLPTSSSFWDGGFRALRKRALYPTEKSDVYKEIVKIRKGTLK